MCANHITPCSLKSWFPDPPPANTELISSVMSSALFLDRHSQMNQCLHTRHECASNWFHNPIVALVKLVWPTSLSEFSCKRLIGANKLWLCCKSLCAHSWWVCSFGFWLFFFHESSVRQSYTHWKEAFMVGLKEMVSTMASADITWPEGHTSPMIELNTKASMVQGLCSKSRDTLVSKQSLLTEQTHTYVFVSRSLNPIVSLCLLLTCSLFVFFFFTLFFHESEQLLF